MHYLLVTFGVVSVWFSDTVQDQEGPDVKVKTSCTKVAVVNDCPMSSKLLAHGQRWSKHWPSVSACFGKTVSLKRQQLENPVRRANVRDTNPVPAQCWGSIFDAAPALSQHWAGVSCSPGSIHVRDTCWTLFVGSCSPRQLTSDRLPGPVSENRINDPNSGSYGTICQSGSAHVICSLSMSTVRWRKGISSRPRRFARRKSLFIKIRGRGIIAISECFLWSRVLLYICIKYGRHVLYVFSLLFLFAENQGHCHKLIAWRSFFTSFSSCWNLDKCVVRNEIIKIQKTKLNKIKYFKALIHAKVNWQNVY